jgi:hypothetical protein
MRIRIKTAIAWSVTIAIFFAIYWIGRGPAPRTPFEEDTGSGFQTTAPYPDNITALFIPTGGNVPSVIRQGRSWYEVYYSSREKAADRERKIVTPALLEQLAEATVFDGPRVLRTESVIEALNKSPNLQWMRVAEQYDSDDLTWIGGFKRLRGLDLFNGERSLAAADLSLLRNLTELQWLQIYASSYPRQPLPRFPKLEYLQIRGQITDGTLANLGSSPNLRVLEVSSSQLTDGALKKLANDCPNLQYLKIVGCGGFTRSGAAEIGRLSQLRWLAIRRTQLVEDVAALKKLQAKLPDCYISWGS